MLTQYPWRYFFYFFTSNLYVQLTIPNSSHYSRSLYLPISYKGTNSEKWSTFLPYQTFGEVRWKTENAKHYGRLKKHFSSFWDIVYRSPLIRRLYVSFVTNSQCYFILFIFYTIVFIFTSNTLSLVHYLNLYNKNRK